MLRTGRIALGTIQISLLLGLAACNGSGADAVAPTSATEAASKTGMIRITGLVRYTGIMDGCYIIQGNNGTNYEPTNLPVDFQKDGLAVEAQVRQLDMADLCMAGRLVEIVKIQALPQVSGRVGA